MIEKDTWPLETGRSDDACDIDDQVRRFRAVLENVDRSIVGAVSWFCTTTAWSSSLESGQSYGPCDIDDEVRRFRGALENVDHSAAGGMEWNCIAMSHDMVARLDRRAKEVEDLDLPAALPDTQAETQRETERFTMRRPTRRQILASLFGLKPPDDRPRKMDG